MKKKTKIIATHGPSIQGEKGIQDLYDAGVNVIRFNFSHAQYESVRETLQIIRSLNSQGKTNLSTLLDTKGPEIRTGDLAQKIMFKKGDIFKIYVDAQAFQDNGQNIFCDYPYLAQDAFVGQMIQIDSGLFQVKVLEISDTYVSVEALNDALIGNRRHINLPGIKLKLPGITQKDKEDIAFAIAEKMDFIALSFVRNAQNVQELQSFLAEHDAQTIKIIAKIENQEGVENMLEIIDQSDGVMVARGDLGIEVAIEKLPIYQSTMVKQALMRGKFTVIATHLLESMIENPFPTRAEVSDVYNSVMQRTDAVMLSGETASGKYPILATQMMAKCVEEAEKNTHFQHYDFSAQGLTPRDMEKKSLIRSAIYSGEDLEVKALFIFTKSGKLARLASSFRPNMPIYAFTYKESSLRYMNVLFGVYPSLIEDWDDDFTKNKDRAIQLAKSKGQLVVGDKIILVNDVREAGKEIPLIELYEIDN